MLKKALITMTLLVIIAAIAAALIYKNTKTGMELKDIKINKWHFDLSFDLFKVESPEKGIIKIIKKKQDKEIQGGFILLNKRFFRLKEFLTGKDAAFQREITLRPTNFLIVFMRGAAGASVKVDIKKGGNSNPVAKNDKATTYMAMAVGIRVLANDTDRDGDALSISSFTKAAHGKLVDRGRGTLKYTPAKGFRGKDNFTYTISDGKGGRDTAKVNVNVISQQIILKITHPLNGEKITRPDVMIKGRIINPAGNETKVTVNGATANVFDNQFVINHVPLKEDKNTITASATDRNGNTAATSVSVKAERAGHYIKISADPEYGTSPLETTLRVEGTFGFVEPFLTYTGPGNAEFFEMASNNEYGVRIKTKGIYFFTAEVIDTKSNTNYTNTIAITVL